MRLIKAAVILGPLLLLWWGGSASGLINPLFLPKLPDFAGEFVSTLTSAEIYCDILATLYRAGMGLLLSVLVGVPLGLFFGRRQSLYEFFEVIVDFFRSVPSSALFFLFVLIFGVGDASKIAVVFYGCFLIMLVSAVYGASPSREKSDRIRMLKVYGASEYQVFKYAVFPDSLPQIFSGLRICISLALVLVVVTEMFLSATDGLGRRIYDAYLAYRVSEMYVGITILGIIGYLVNQLSFAIERQTLFWAPIDDGYKL